MPDPWDAVLEEIKQGPPTGSTHPSGFEKGFRFGTRRKVAPPDRITLQQARQLFSEAERYAREDKPLVDKALREEAGKIIGVSPGSVPPFEGLHPSIKELAGRRALKRSRVRLPAVGGDFAAIVRGFDSPKRWQMEVKRVDDMLAGKREADLSQLPLRVGPDGTPYIHFRERVILTSEDHARHLKAYSERIGEDLGRIEAVQAPSSLDVLTFALPFGSTKLAANIGKQIFSRTGSKAAARIAQWTADMAGGVAEFSVRMEADQGLERTLYASGEGLESVGRSFVKLGKAIGTVNFSDLNVEDYFNLATGVLSAAFVKMQRLGMGPREREQVRKLLDPVIDQKLSAASPEDLLYLSLLRDDISRFPMPGKARRDLLSWFDERLGIKEPSRASQVRTDQAEAPAAGPVSGKAKGSPDLQQPKIEGTGAPELPPEKATEIARTFKLSKRLRGSKVSISGRQVRFESDLDRALYISREGGGASQRSSFIREIASRTGLSEDVIGRLGLGVKALVKDAATKADTAEVLFPTSSIAKNLDVNALPGPKMVDGIASQVPSIRAMLAGPEIKSATPVEKASTKKAKNLVSDDKGFLDLRKASRTINRSTARMAKWLGIEPSKVVEQKSPEAYARIMRGFHSRESGIERISQLELRQAKDLSVKGLSDMLARYDDEALETLKLAISNPANIRSKKARKLHQKALASLHPDFRDASGRGIDPNLRASLQELSDFNFRLAEVVEGPGNIGYTEDYWYGQYKRKEAARRFYDGFRRTAKGFTLSKKFPTYADARAAQLQHLHANPVTNLLGEAEAILERMAMKDLARDLVTLGFAKQLRKGLVPSGLSKKGWRKLGSGDEIFNRYAFEPDTASLLDNLLSHNKVTMDSRLNLLRLGSAGARGILLSWPTFHFKTELAQAIADSGLFGMLDPKFRGPSSIARAAGKTPIENQEWYLDMVNIGGGKRVSQEAEAISLVDKAMRSTLGKSLVVPELIGAYNDWLFERFIPRLKAFKYYDELTRLEAKHKRPLLDHEKIKIIKEGQNFYGEMNERLFGRSGTMTSLLRLLYLAPGFREGNFRTIGRALFKPEDLRSKRNVVYTVLQVGLAGAVAKRIITGEWPSQPKTVEDFRDLFKVPVPALVGGGILKDDRGREIMIDLMTFERDYWSFLWKPFVSKVFGVSNEKVINELLSDFRETTSNMVAPGAKAANKLFEAWTTGRPVTDWKGDLVWFPTDDPLQKMWKFLASEVTGILPISASSAIRAYHMANEGDVRDRAIFSAVTFAAALRPARSEHEKSLHKLFGVLRVAHGSEGYRDKVLREAQNHSNPRKLINDYNAIWDRVLVEPLPEDIQRSILRRDPRIRIDTFLQNQALRLGRRESIKNDPRDIERAIKTLSNFGYRDRKSIMKLISESGIKDPDTILNYAIRIKRRLAGEDQAERQ